MVLLSTADSHELREKERKRLATDVTEMVCFVLLCSVCQFCFIIMQWFILVVMYYTHYSGIISVSN